MPSFVPLVPPPNRGGAGFASSASAGDAAYPAPVCWTLFVLAWLAFGVSSYLAWKALTNSAVAGCTLGSHVGCDLVLNSSWSKWLGIPISFLGLAVYASLASLALLLGVRNASANRWITTVFVLLSIVAASASVWFVGIQIFVLRDFCKYCLVADTCGIVIGILATAFAIRAVIEHRAAPQPRAMQPGLMALRTTMPSGSRSPLPTLQAAPATPALIPAALGAIAMFVLLIGGQLLFAGKTYIDEKGTLDKSIDLMASKTANTEKDATNPETHVAMRPTTEPDAVARTNDPGDSSKGNSPSASRQHADKSATAGTEKATDASQAPVAPAEPARRRLLKLLNGKLTLDVYQHPIIGSPEAPHIAIEMVSYDCPHCRKMYATMKHALERYGDQVALVVMVVPMEMDCNKLVTDPAASHQGACATAKLALGVARLEPNSFAAFHDFLMSGKDKPPEVAAVVPKANVMADRTQLRQLTQGDELSKQITAYVDLFAQLQKQNQSKKEFGLPVQILGDYVMSGSVEKEEEVFKAWEEHLGVKAR